MCRLEDSLEHPSRTIWRQWKSFFYWTQMFLLIKTGLPLRPLYVVPVRPFIERTLVARHLLPFDTLVAVLNWNDHREQVTIDTQWTTLARYLLKRTLTALHQAQLNNFFNKRGYFLFVTWMEHKFVRKTVPQYVASERNYLRLFFSCTKWIGKEKERKVKLARVSSLGSDNEILLWGFLYCSSWDTWANLHFHFRCCRIQLLRRGGNVTFQLIWASRRPWKWS